MDFVLVEASLGKRFPELRFECSVSVDEKTDIAAIYVWDGYHVIISAKRTNGVTFVADFRRFLIGGGCCSSYYREEEVEELMGRLLEEYVAKRKEILHPQA